MARWCSLCNQRCPAVHVFKFVSQLHSVGKIHHESSEYFENPCCLFLGDSVRHKGIVFFIFFVFYSFQFCQMCRKGDNEELLLLCDACDRGYHTYCCTVSLIHVMTMGLMSCGWFVHIFSFNMLAISWWIVHLCISAKVSVYTRRGLVLYGLHRAGKSIHHYNARFAWITSVESVWNTVLFPRRCHTVVSTSTNT